MEPYGIIVLDKPKGMTSHTAVAKVKRLLGASKAGHTGTLDPMATGVLPVLVGRAVKVASYVVEGEKHYVAEMTLGMTTDTQDSTGKILTTSNDIPSEEKVREVAQTFLGEILQVPPMFSAIQVGGVRLMDMARKGKEIEREARPVTVYALDVTKKSETVYLIDVRCSKGTYIRTICADIGDALGCGAVMSGLCRVETGGFLLSQAISLEKLEQTPPEMRQTFLHLPEETTFKNFPEYHAPAFFDHLLYHGLAVSLKKLPGAPRQVGTKVRLYDKLGFFGIGTVKGEAELLAEWEQSEQNTPKPDGDALQCEKVIRLKPPLR